MEIVEASIGGVLSDLVASHKFRTYDLMIMRICGILSFPYEILWVFFFYERLWPYYEFVMACLI